MVRGPSIALCTFAIVLIFGATSATGQRQTYQNRIGWHLVNGVWMRASGQCEWSDLIRFRWRGQQLLIEAKPTNKAIGLLKGDQMDAVVRDATMLGVAAIVPVASAHVALDKRGR